jgi:hypothetical protein
MTDPNDSGFRVGDQVRIESPHPWKGTTGQIIREFDPPYPQPGLRWIVSLDPLGTGEAFAADEDLTRVE